MPDRVGAYHDNGVPAYWIDDAGKPYRMLTVNGRETGQRVYLSPYATPGVSLEEARASRPQGGFFRGGGEWDTERGVWNQPWNGGNLLALGVGGALAAPFLAGTLGGFAGGGGVAPAASASGATAAPVAAGAATAAAPAAAGAATAAGSTLGGLMPSIAGQALRYGIPAGINALTSYFGNRATANAAEKAAELEAQAAAEALAFMREQETARQREWRETQDRNYAIYREEQAREEGRYRDREARLGPYRQAGVGSLAQLAQPIYR